MENSDKTNGQSIQGLPELRGRIKELESAAAASKRLGKMLEESATYAENIIDTVREPLLVLDSSLKIISANHSFYVSFKVTPQETIGNLIYDLGNRQWDIPKLRKLLEEILPKDNKFDDYEVEHKFSSIGHKTMLLNARRITQQEIGSQLILLAIEDITERKEIENGLENARKELAITKISEDEAREYAESIINTVREPLLALDSDLRVVKANRSFYDLFKVRPEETIGNLIYALGNRQWDIPMLRTLLEDILPKDNKFDDYQIDHTFQSIGRKIMLLNARQIRTKRDLQNLVLLAIEDITERTLLEIERKEWEERFRRLFETAKDGLLLLNKQTGNIVEVNKSITDMLGYSSKEIVGKMVQDVGLLKDINDFSETILELLQAGVINYENVLTETKDGHVLNTDIYLVDRARLIQCNVRDTTVKVQTEEALKQSEAKFRNLVEQSILGVYIVQDNLLRYCNPRFAEIFEYTPEEVIGIKSPQDFVFPEDWPLVQDNIRKSMSGEAPTFHFDFRGITKKGRIINAEVHGSHSMFDDRPARLMTLIDITEMLAAREEIIKKTGEAEILKQENRHSEEMNTLKSEFLANMSHELRTPLNAIIGLSTVLLENTYGELNAKQGEYISGVIQSGQHLLALINEILDLSRIEAGSERIEPSDFSMADVLNNSFIMFNERAAKHGIELVKEIGQEIGRFYADEMRVKQIIFNLLSNAVKFTNPGGKVGLRASRDGSSLVITVWDTGIGIPEDKKHLIFQPFQMIDSSLARKHEGTGLGLALTKKLVELHGGTITFESMKGAGTSFTVTLPFVSPTLSAALGVTGEPADSSPEREPGTRYDSGTVMVVEDNRLNMLLAVDYLKAHGCQTMEAYDGETAIEKAKAEKIGVILLDIQMPGIDGFEVIKRLKDDPATSNIPVIAMTALAMKGDEEKCLRAGFTDYISKPVNLALMLEKVQTWLRKAA